MNRIGALISPFVKTLGIEEALRLEEMRGEWPKIFNEPLSLHIFPSNLQKGTLVINADSSVWLQQVSFYKAEIVKKLLPFGVKDVRFRLGRMGKAHRRAAAETRGPAKKLALDNAAREYVERTVSEIEDAELKSAIRSAMERSLSSGSPTRIS